MAWARVDDGWWAHPKVLGLSLEARGLWVTALSWSCAQRRDIVPESLVWMVAGYRRGVVLTAEIERAGLWIPVDDGDGWVIHDWAHLYQSGRRSRIPARVRHAVFARDEFACTNCGSTENLSIDHIVPRALGGADTPRNLQTLCLSCNSRKGDAAPGDDSWRG